MGAAARAAHDHGENILRQLHLYIAYKEKDLYITPAAATPADPVTEGPPKPPPGLIVGFHLFMPMRRTVCAPRRPCLEAEAGQNPAMTKPNPQDVLQNLIRASKSAGADAADALLVESVSASVSYRLGKLEDIERAESSDLGLRVFIGQQVAFVSSTVFSREALDALPGRAVAMARLAPEDKYAGLAPADRLARDLPALDIEDPVEPSADTLIARARDAEGAALAVPGITNSEGGGASFSRSAVSLATSEGFFGRYAGHQPRNRRRRAGPAKAPTCRPITTRPAHAMPATSTRPRRSASAPANAPWRGSIRTRSNRRPCPSSSIRAFPAVWSAISRARSPAPPSRAA